MAAGGQVIQGRFDRGGLRMAPPAGERLVRRGHAVQLPANLEPSIPRPGQSLAPAVQAKMEAVFGTDFSQVRVHVGPQAQSLGAQAFTLGSSIHFAPGAYQPSSPHGQRLLAHELTHVVQQRTHRVRNPFGGGIAVVNDPGLEAEADRMALQALRSFLPNAFPHTSGSHVASAIGRAMHVPGPAGPSVNGPSVMQQKSMQPANVYGTSQSDTVQAIRLVNSSPTWSETRSYVIGHASSFGNTSTVNFGSGNEDAFKCPSCKRVLPVRNATVDHIVPKSLLRSSLRLGGVSGAEVMINKGRGSYGLNKDLDWKNVKYRVHKPKQGGWKWTGRKKVKNDYSGEDYLEGKVENDLDNLQLMCHSCNSSKGNSNNPSGSNAPPTNTKSKVTKTISVQSTTVSIEVAPDVDPKDSHPSSKFSTAWGKTRQFFLAEKYHAMGVAKKDFGTGVSEPAYTCGSCSRVFPIAIATVDHVQPKEGYWWRSLDLSNLSLMCNICNSSKGNH